MNIRLAIFLFYSLMKISAYGQETKQENMSKDIHVIPGLGFVIEKDTVKLSKTTESEIYHLFKIKDTLTKIIHGTACGYDANGNSASWDTYSKEITYDGIVFNYSGSTNKDNFILDEIEIKDITHFNVKINDSIVLGKVIPDILNYFPKRNSFDEYDKYSIDLGSYGINFLLDDTGLQKKLSYISISDAIVSSVISVDNEKEMSDDEIVAIEKLYIVGDIDNDKKIDSAYVSYEERIRKDGKIEKECVSKNCEVKIKFTGNIPDLIINQSLGIYIQETKDLNNDNANEILLFSEWVEGYWGKMFVWSFKNGIWQEIARTKAFLSDEKDYENRITQIKSQFYLIGDGWDDSKGGVVERSLKVEIKK